MSYTMAQLNPGLLAQFTPLPAFLQTCIILWRLVESKEAIAMCMCQTHPSSLTHGWVYFVSCVDTSHERRSGTQKMKYTQAFIPHTLIKFTFWIHSQQSCMEVSCSFPPACYELSPVAWHHYAPADGSAVSGMKVFGMVAVVVVCC